MDIELRNKVNLLSENYKEIKKQLRSDGDLFNHFEALLYGLTDKKLDLEKINEIREYIKSKKTNSIFKGNFLKIFSILMDNREDYKEVYKNTIIVYDFLVSKGFTYSNETVFASFILSKRFQEEELNYRVNKLIEIKELLGSNEYISCANLAAGNKDIKTIEKEFNEVKQTMISLGYFYDCEKENFILTLISNEGNLKERTKKAINILKEIEEKYLINSLNFLSLIVIASLFTSCEKSFISEFNDVYNILKETKGYRFFISKEVRLIISLCIVINKYTEEMKADLIDININDEISILLVLEEQTAISIASI